jgi:nucleoside-diphosphate-sugar epimerase
MTILVTGASGFIARGVARTLRAEGHRLIGVTSGSGPTAYYHRVVHARLGESLQPTFDSEAVDAVVHTAYYAGKGEYNVNFDGTSRWLEEALSAGVDTNVFLSSLSAPGGASDYARAKLDLEGAFVEAGGACLRLGVVVGDGGMFARMRESVRRFTLLPLLDNGSAPVYVLGIEYLCRVVRDCAVEGRRYGGRVWHLQQPERHTLREVLATIRDVYGFRCVFVPVPSLPVLWMVTTLEAIGARLPVASANIRGLRRGAGQEFPCDFAHFGYEATPLRHLVEKAASARAR